MKHLAYVLFSPSTKKYHWSDSFDGTEHITNTNFYNTETMAIKGLRGVNSYIKATKNRRPDIKFIEDFEVIPLEIKHI